MSDHNPAHINNTDDEIIRQIDSLVDEEHRLERDHAGDGLDDAGRTRLRELEVQLDQAWDLLRQRRARRSAGLDPDEAGVRDAAVVERYQQ